MNASSSPVIDIALLDAPGKASISESNGGAVTLRGNNALKALQMIVVHGGIRIHLSQHEIDDLLAAGKLQITVNFSRHDSSSATQAAQQIVNMANAALQAKHDAAQRSAGRKIGYALMLIVLVVLAFLLAISLLDVIYGTHQLEELMGRIQGGMFIDHLPKIFRSGFI